ncbi:SIMPL domain-containing protein [Deminuibacter soli]|uniref:DUF541 domain-containing protein n=1 Tax=Deminuibacter soli TaxID=2291815 RepID=A0A3E1NLH4_9BACT|nr:SIMPL domain-containing protein [Deminuibacter soli]RFM28790.1 DUF541 domain-containing protein [Deminuibacter soli]
MKKIAAIAAACFTLFQAHAQEITSKTRSINVTGTAELEVVPDEIYVQVELREYNRKNGTKTDINDISNAFLAAAKSMGLTEKEVSVQSYQGWDGNYWLYKKKKEKTPDMKAGVNYWVKVKSVQQMNELVGKLDDEATQNFFIAKVSHSELETYKKQLKVQAIKNAKDKAVYLADALNEKVGGALTINDPEEMNNAPMPRMYAMAASADGGAPAMNVDFKKIKLQFSVNVVFALL